MKTTWKCHNEISCFLIDQNYFDSIFSENLKNKKLVRKVFFIDTTTTLQGGGRGILNPTREKISTHLRIDEHVFVTVEILAAMRFIMVIEVVKFLHQIDEFVTIFKLYCDPKSFSVFIFDVNVMTVVHRPKIVFFDVIVEASENA
jgi:hypothetical protein